MPCWEIKTHLKTLKKNVHSSVFEEALSIHYENENMVVGIFDPKWGLTLPGLTHNLDTVKANILKTLSLFRKHLKKRETRRHQPINPERAGLLTKNAGTILKSYHTL